jgi:hypothetical protein
MKLSESKSYYIVNDSKLYQEILDYYQWLKESKELVSNSGPYLNKRPNKK